MEKVWFNNCLNIIETDEGWLPVRFSPHQLEMFAQHDIFRIRSLCTAGITLDFYTDASFVQFNYVVKEWIRDYLAFDIYIDGIYVDQVYMERLSKGEHTFRYELSQLNGSNRERRMTIYLPHNVQLTLHPFELPPEAMIRPAESFEKTLLCLGDSITQGMDAVNPSLSYPSLLAHQLNMRLINQGVGGHIFDESTMDPNVPLKPDLITIAYGTNDWNRYQRLNELEQACEAYLLKLNDMFPGIPKFVITPIWRVDGGEARQTGTFEEVCTSISEIAGRIPDTIVINGLELVPHLPAMYADLVHPNNEGFAHMAMNLAARIRKG
ncbi:SGNH/GDSL hydrolase family protein [Paenibacillus sp. strain BS8-2]